MQRMDNQESDNTHGTGITMVILAWVVILGLLAWWFDDYEKSQYNPNQQITHVLLLQANRKLCYNAIVMAIMLPPAKLMANP